MGYRVLADLVLVLHLGFVLFVVLGGLLVLRWRWLLWLHVPAAAWGILISFAGWLCPLTPLEKRLRQLGGEAGFEGGFVEHYLTSLIYPSGLNRATQIVLGGAVLLVNLFVYWRVVAHVRGRGVRAPTARPA